MRIRAGARFHGLGACSLEFNRRFASAGFDWQFVGFLATYDAIEGGCRTPEYDENVMARLPRVAIHPLVEFLGREPVLTVYPVVVLLPLDLCELRGRVLAGVRPLLDHLTGLG